MKDYNQNLHTHSIFSDGKNTPEEIIERAIELNFNSIGFSEHSKMNFPVTGAPTDEAVINGKNEVYRLREKYKGVITVYHGTEQDLYSTQDLSDFDYVIGSCHCMPLNGEIIEFDDGKDAVKRSIDRHFNGNGLDFAYCYYQNFERLSTLSRIDIVGHADLVSKHSETSNFFDVNSTKYQQFALNSIRKVFERCQVFEVNTGAVARGYKNGFYPAPFIMEELKRLGAKMVISSDCHNKDFLNCKFNEALKYILSFGFDSAYIFDGEKFIPFK